MIDLPAFALSEFERRRPIANRMFADRHWNKARREHELSKWLAIAVVAGATPQVGDLAEMIAENVAAGVPEAQVREALAGDICPADDWKAELARARDAALADRSGSPFATAIYLLALALGAPPPLPVEAERKVA